MENRPEADGTRRWECVVVAQREPSEAAVCRWVKPKPRKQARQCRR